jgi:AraC family transcriptional regulator
MVAHLLVIASPEIREAGPGPEEWAMNDEPQASDVAHTAAVERVIEYMYANLAYEITIDDMARTAMFSKFHFSRLFHDVTGLSPGRFLSAVRLQAAKRMLISTTMSVTEICFCAGYNSVGTFSSRFAAIVGVPPTVYRYNGGYISELSVNARRNNWASSSNTLSGKIITPSSEPGELAFVGVFPDPLIQGKPIKYAICENLPATFSLDGIPAGTWYLLSYSFTQGDNSLVLNSAHDSVSPLVAVHGPIAVKSRLPVKPVEMVMRPMRMIDPPVLLAVPNVGPQRAKRSLS